MSKEKLPTKTSIYLQKIIENIEESCELDSQYDENREKYIVAIQQTSKPVSNTIYKEPRERRRLAKMKKYKKIKSDSIKMHPFEVEKTKQMASFVPDEIIHDHSNYEPKHYEAALMFADVSGFTELCEAYTQTGTDGTSRLTQVLNTYIGNMVHEILIHDGDLLKFSGDAFLAMWKSTPSCTIQEAVHAAIDCALIIQRDFGSYTTDIGITLRVKVAIAGGTVLFSLIGDSNNSHYLVVGQPVWDVKAAEYMSKAGDVIASPSAWKYVNSVQYIYKQMKDNPHILIMGTGAMWRNVEKIDVHIDSNTEDESMLRTTKHNSDSEDEDDSDSEEDSLSITDHINNLLQSHTDRKLDNIRLCIDIAIRRNMKEPLKKFILTPVLNAIYKNEQLEYLTEMRQVVIVFLNVILDTVSNEVMTEVTNEAYKEVCKIVNNKRGLVNKVSLFDKDMMFLIVFGLREMKHEKETQNALHCAFALRKKLVDFNDKVKSVSVGVTSGPAYCGVVGHILRREYTMIGLCVNKAARLMVNYPDKVTCDYETCLKSKLNRKGFTLMPFKPLKGLTEVGAIYEFNADDLNLKTTICNYSMVNRFTEIKTYNDWMQTLLKNENQKDDQFWAAAIIGETMVGKSRLLNAIEELTPDTVKFIKINILNTQKNIHYFLIKEIIKIAFNDYISEKGVEVGSLQFNSIFGEDLSKIQMLFIQEVFNLNTDPNSKTSAEIKYTDVYEIITKLFKIILDKVTIVAIDRSENIDEKSWKLVPKLISECKIAILAVVEESGENMKAIIENPNTVHIHVKPLSLWHHSALVCSMLSVNAITPRLENVIQMYSDGNPGWIENFLIMLTQDGKIYVSELIRDEALSLGVVMPHTYDFNWVKEESKDNISTCSINPQHGWRIFESTFKEIDDVKICLSKPPQDYMQVAFLKNPDSFNNVVTEVNKDIIFLKTYDSLLPFEQLVLKCCSALGEIFSRALLLFVLSINADLAIAKAFVKLFDIGFLACARGDFSKNLGNIFINRSSVFEVKDGTCQCIGINENEKKLAGLPPYAWCGYTRFKDTNIFKSTYNLLTENQKKNFHTKAIVYLEKYTKQCVSCRSENFNKLLGYKKEDEFRDEEVETYVASLKEGNFENDLENQLPKRMTKKLVESNLLRQTYNFKSLKLEDKNKKNDSDIISIKSFSEFNNKYCHCFQILSVVYTQIIEHCKKSDQIHKLSEGYVEYILFSIKYKNIPLAISLLNEAEAFMKSPKFVLPKNHERFEKWRTNFLIGRLYSLRGLAMLEMKDYLVAEKYLGLALELFRCQFPLHSKSTFKNLKNKLEFELYAKLKNNQFNDVEKAYFNQVSETLSYIYQISTAGGKHLLAYKAAEWSLKYALAAYDNFPVLCTAYGNFLTASVSLSKSGARKLISSALKICTLKDNMDRIELEYVIFLYNSILHFLVWNSDTKGAYDICQTLYYLLNGRPDKLRLFSLKIFCEISISQKNFSECKLIIEQLKRMKSINGNEAIEYNAWYIITVLNIHLDTGYTIEKFKNCMNFYKEEESTLKIKNEEVFWTVTINIWLRGVRLNSEERFIWTVDNLINMAYSLLRNHVLVKIRLVEGTLLCLVNAMNDNDIKEYTRLKIIIEQLLQNIKQSCKNNKNLLSRYYLMKAYFRFIIHNDKKVLKFLEHGLILAIEGEDLIMQDIFAHNEKAWDNRLTTEDRDIWKNHCSPGTELDIEKTKKYRDGIHVFTLPTPKRRF